jgi:hypothetical protein
MNSRRPSRPRATSSSKAVSCVRDRGHSRLHLENIDFSDLVREIVGEHEPRIKAVGIEFEREISDLPAMLEVTASAYGKSSTIFSPTPSRGEDTKRNLKHVRQGLLRRLPSTRPMTALMGIFVLRQRIQEDEAEMLANYGDE